MYSVKEIKEDLTYIRRQIDRDKTAAYIEVRLDSLISCVDHLIKIVDLVLDRMETNNEQAN